MFAVSSSMVFWRACNVAQAMCGVTSRLLPSKSISGLPSAGDIVAEVVRKIENATEHMLGDLAFISITKNLGVGQQGMQLADIKTRAHRVPVK